MKTVVIFGTFDRLHPGHHYVIEQAKKYGELHVVVARDDSVQHIKGRLPVQNEQERVQAIRDYDPDVFARLGHESDYQQPLREIKPDLIVLGYDQRLPPGVTEADFNCEVIRLDSHEPHKYKSSLMGG